jgi:hypothetical protein
MDVLAYFDPSSGSLVMQALIGGSAGMMVFLRFVWKTWVRDNPSKPQSTKEP